MGGRIVGVDTLEWTQEGSYGNGGKDGNSSLQVNVHS